jgi:hypothetical protein
MNEIEQKRAIKNLKESMYVNEDLKKELRKEFINSSKKRSSSHKKGGFIAAAIACGLILTTTITNLTPVSAEELNVINYVSVMDLPLNSQHTPSEHKGTIYIPVAGDGLYTYNNSEFTKVYDGNIQHAEVSPNAKQIALTKEGSIYIYEVKDKKVTAKLEGDRNSLFEEPSWLPDSSGIIFTKRKLGENEQKELVVQKTTIAKMDITSGKLSELAAGEHGSFVKGKNAIVFQKEDKIYYKDLETNVEALIDEGNDPSISPEGKNIAYTKSEITYKEISKNVKIETGLQNVWIADVEDFSKKKKITFNFPIKFISEEDWLTSIKPSDELQMLSYNGRYGYVKPSWSSDGKSVYILRRDYNITNRPSQPELIKIDLDNRKLSAKETVSRYIQAIMASDADYATSLDMSYIEHNAEERIIDFSILDQGKLKEKGEQFIDVKVQWQTSSGKANKLEKIRYFLKDKDGTFLISGKEIIDTTEVSFDRRSVSGINKSDKSILFTLEDLNIRININ